MSWLVFVFALELGFVPEGIVLMYDRQPVEYVNENSVPLTTVEDLNFSYSVYTDLYVEAVILEYLFIGGGVRVTMLPTTDYTFDPHACYYTFAFGGRLGPIEVFWRHYCMHPQMTYMHDYLPLDAWEGAYDEIGLKVKGEIPWKIER